MYKSIASPQRVKERFIQMVAKSGEPFGSEKEVSNVFELKKKTDMVI